MLLPKPTGSDFELAPSGTFAARCYRFVDLGTQPKLYNGSTTLKRMVGISWELPDELMKDGKPFSIYQRYVWSMSEKSTLRKHLESWRGVKFVDADFGSFDTRKLIGVPCMIGITHVAKEGKTYANISSISRPLKGLEVPAIVNEPLYFSLDEFDQTAFDRLSQSMKQTIMASPEYATLFNHDFEHGAEVGDVISADCPF